MPETKRRNIRGALAMKSQQYLHERSALACLLVVRRTILRSTLGSKCSNILKVLSRTLSENVMMDPYWISCHIVSFFQELMGAGEQIYKNVGSVDQRGEAAIASTGEHRRPCALRTSSTRSNMLASSVISQRIVWCLWTLLTYRCHFF